MSETLNKLQLGLTSGKCLLIQTLQNKLLKLSFPTKKNKADLPLVTFNGIPVKRDIETKHLGMVLDSKLTYKSHLEGTNGRLAKARKGLGLMRQLKRWTSHSVLETVYKAYVRAHPDYGDILFHTDDLTKHSVWNVEATDTLLRKVETIQYDAA